MGSARATRLAVALSRFDVSDAGELLIHSCEDCACSVGGDGTPIHQTLPTSVTKADTRWVPAKDAAEFPLDREHRILFNPLGSCGVVVVNNLAYQIYRDIQCPITAGELTRMHPEHRDDVEAILQRLSQLQLIHPAGRPPRPSFEEGRVLTAWLHVTNACNLRCPYCYVNKTSVAMDESTGRAAVEAVIRSAVNHGFRGVKLKYAGGEASLNHHLVVSLHGYACNLAAKSGLRLSATLLSNGVRLPEHLITACQDAGIRIMISLDGIGAAHDTQRPFVNGKPSFRYVERSISKLIERGHPPHLSITITNRNADFLPDVVRFALERDLTFSLNLFRDNECADSFSDLQYEERAMTKALLAAFGEIENRLPRWSVLGSILDRGQLIQPRQRSCGVGQDYVVIDERGRVAKCHMEIERTLGDVFADDPLQLVRQDRTIALNLLVDEKEGCRDCTWRYWCSGGCSVATFRATGRYDIKSPNCNIYKAIYPQALRLEGLRLLKYATVGP